MVDLDLLRAEHRREVIGEQLRRLLFDLAYATCRQYPPRQYGAGGSWNSQAVEDLLHDWVAERLIDGKHLPVLIASASSLSGLKAGLTRDLRQYLANRQRKATTAHLFHRLDSLLASDPTFKRVGPQARSGDQRWTLSDAPDSDPSRLGNAELASIAWELRATDLPQVWYKPESRKTSPVLRLPELKRLLEHLLNHAHGSLTLAEIARAVFHRLGLEEPTLEELAESISAEQPPLDSVLLRELVGTLVARLGRGPLRVIAVTEQEGSVRGAAARLDLPEAEVLRQLAQIGQAINEEVDSIAEAEATYRELANRCSKEVWQ